MLFFDRDDWPMERPLRRIRLHLYLHYQVSNVLEDLDRLYASLLCCFLCCFPKDSGAGWSSGDEESDNKRPPFLP